MMIWGLWWWWWWWYEGDKKKNRAMLLTSWTAALFCSLPQVEIKLNAMFSKFENLELSDWVWIYWSIYASEKRKILKTSNKTYEITIKLENNMKSIWLKTKLYKHCALWPIFRWWCSNWRPILTWKPISRYPNIIRFVRCKPGNECLKSSTICVR